MIICVSLNPAIDRRLRVESLRPGAVNRALAADSFAGGKAAHVAMAARALGEKVLWIGFAGGASGDELLRQLSKLKIQTAAVSTASSTRINDEIIGADGTVTEILEPGGAISNDELTELLDVCRREIKGTKARFQFVLSGSLPPNVPVDVYSSLTNIAREFGGHVIVDTSGDAFIETLSAEPDLIKPNSEEAQNAVGFEIDSVESAFSASFRLRELGAKAVAISLGAKGMIWSGGNESLIAKAPNVDVISTVGCGDAAVAGFAVAALRQLNTAETLRLAVACGTANCLAKRPGQIDPRDVDRLLPMVTIQERTSPT